MAEQPDRYQPYSALIDRQTHIATLARVEDGPRARAIGEAGTEEGARRAPPLRAHGLIHVGPGSREARTPVVTEAIRATRGLARALSLLAAVRWEVSAAGLEIDLGGAIANHLRRHLVEADVREVRSEVGAGVETI